MAYWSKIYSTYYESKINSIVLTSAEEVIGVGYIKRSSFSTNKSAWIIKLDKNGEFIWQKICGGSNEDVANSVALLPNGDMIVVGYTTSFGAKGKNAWILRLDSQGNVKWEKVYGGSKNDEAKHVVVHPNGNILVLGETESFGAGGMDLWLMALDENGNLLWQKTYGGEYNESAGGITVISDGDIIVAGSKSMNILILRLNDKGEIKWQKMYRSEYSKKVYDITTLDDDSIVIVGGSSHNESGWFILCVDNKGNIKWSREYNGGVARAVVSHSRGNIIVSGNKTKFSDIVLLALDKEGNELWQRIYGGNGLDYPTTLTVFPNGDILLVARTASFNVPTSQPWILKLPPNGYIPDCSFCKKDKLLKTRKIVYHAEDANLTVLSSAKVIRKKGLIKKKKTILQAKFLVGDIKSKVETPNYTIKIVNLYHTDIDQDTFSNMLKVKIPELHELKPTEIKFTVENNLSTELKIIIDVSRNEYFDVDNTLIEFPPIGQGHKVTRTLTITPQNTGSFKFKFRAIVNGLIFERTIPVIVKKAPIASESSVQFPEMFPSKLLEFYDDVRYIGEGGFARVFKAKRKKDGLTVAIKIPINMSPAVGKTFLREIENWTKLDHPNVVKVYDYNILPVPFIEMEYCDSPLERLLEEKKYLNPIMATRIIFDIAEGLKYAHSKGIIHRDLKPSNILLKQGIPKISDWGLSKVLKESRSTTLISFTPYYAAPEQISKSKFGSTDERTDIWQLGVIFYQLITGQVPFDGDDFVEISSAIIYETPKKPSEINSEAGFLDEIILKCLAKKKEERFASIRDLQQELALILGITYKESLKKSLKINDFSRSAYYAGELLLLHLKLGDLAGAYKYAGDLMVYARGQMKSEIAMLKEQIKVRLQEGISIPPELITKAEIVIHKIRLSFEEI